jgi:hypothetical protein
VLMTELGVVFTDSMSILVSFDPFCFQSECSNICKIPPLCPVCHLSHIGEIKRYSELKRNIVY